MHGPGAVGDDLEKGAWTLPVVVVSVTVM